MSFFRKGLGPGLWGKGPGGGFHLADDALNLILRDFREAAERLGNLRQWVDSGDREREELEMTEQILSTLFLKKDMKALHYSLVFSVCEEVSGLRRLFTVEKSSWEFPGVLLMMLE